MNNYKACMSQKMGSGALKGLTKEQRRIKFCAMAKTCSGKASNEAEAVKICESIPPKPPGEKKPRRSKVAECDCPEFNPMLLMPKCEIAVGRLAGLGQLPQDLDIPSICRAILG